MSDPTSVAQIDLTPIPGKTYFSFDREWREEFIYFLHGRPVSRRSVVRAGASGPDRTRPASTRPTTFYGGTITGITEQSRLHRRTRLHRHLALAVFENNANAYHGYDINNYLNIDPHFGTKQDLIDLVDAAHGFTKNGQPFPSGSFWTW